MLQIWIPSDKYCLCIVYIVSAEETRDGEMKLALISGPALYQWME